MGTVLSRIHTTALRAMCEEVFSIRRPVFVCGGQLIEKPEKYLLFSDDF